MKRSTSALTTAGLAVLFVFGWRAHAERDVALAAARKPVVVTRLFTGPDGQSHVEDMEVVFKEDGRNSDVGALLPVTRAELHRQAPNRVIDWHTGPRRQYVITLSGRGEIEVAGGRTIALEPGHITLVEDTTGKGHITRSVGTDDRVTLWLPLADQGK
jgi:hypothetical protein